MNGVFVNGAFVFNGKIKITQTMPMNIELEMALTRCNTDSTGCSFFDRRYFPRLCDKISVKTSVAYKIVNGIRPPPRCPFHIGEYEFTNNSTLSMELFKSLPLEGFLWKMRCIFHEKKGAKRIKTLACVEYGILIVNKTRRPKV